MSQPDSSRARAKSIGHYILGKTIGEGTFGKVKLGTHILTSERVAVKILEKERIVEVADVERVAREVHILKLIRHPHIVQLYEIIETRRQLYLIMEYASGGELFDYIVGKGRVPELEACRFFHQIIAGLEKVHAMNIVHRDLKPENLLLDEHKNIKIVDFGLSNVFRQGQLLKTACGSPCYAAPEMIAGHSYVPHLCDLWSCGVILFALVCGYLPFEDQNTSALYKKILAADYKTPKFISESVRDLISKLLTTDPTRRYNVPDVRAHPWYCQIPEASTPVPDRVEQGEKQDQKLEEDVLTDLDAFGFPRDYAVRCLQLNKHNHVTTTYYLLSEKKRRLMERLKKLSTGVQGELGPVEACSLAPGGDAAAGTASSSSAAYPVVPKPASTPAVEASSSSSQSGVAARPPAAVRRSGSPPVQSKPTPRTRPSTSPGNPRVTPGSMSVSTSPRQAQGYPQSARARTSARPYVAPKAQESSPPSARRPSSSTSSAAPVAPRSHAGIAAAVANKVAAALSQSERSNRPAGKQVSPSASARTSVTRPGSSMSTQSSSLVQRILSKDPSPPVITRRSTSSAASPTVGSVPRASTARASPTTSGSPRDLTRSTESARRRVAATTATTTASNNTPISTTVPTRTRMGVRPPVQSYRR